MASQHSTDSSFDRMTSGWPAEDRPWAQSFASTLLWEAADHPSWAEDRLADALAVRLEAGESAQSLFGDPRDYARQVVVEEYSAEDEAQTHSGPASPRDAVSLALLALAVPAFLAGVLALVSWFTGGGHLMGISAHGLTLTAALACIFFGGVFAWFQRERGRLAAGLGAAALGLAPVIAWIVAFAVRGEVISLAPFAHLPRLSWFLLAGLLAWAGFSLATGESGTRAAASSSEILNDDDWAARVERLLRGRYLYPRTLAKGAAEEARAHARQAGVVAQEEFGDPAVYAARIARSQNVFPRRRLLWSAGLKLVLAVCFAVNAIGAVTADETSGWTVLAGVVAAVCAVQAWGSWREAQTLR